MISKAELRKHYRGLRRQLSLADMHARLAAMAGHFSGIDFPRQAMVMSYRTMTGKQEVPAGIFEELLADEYEAKGFCFPRVDFASDEMYAIADDEQVRWEQVSFGLEQPAAGNRVEPETLDIILVPLLAFDLSGHRLGYGKGFYDRFLSKCKKGALKIGLSWFAPETSLPEINPFDVPLSHCVTPDRLYVF